MSVETEVKIELTDTGEFLRVLGLQNPLALSTRHFEDNHILDYDDGRIRARQGLIRVRITDQGSWLTFEGPPRPEGIFKSREELETRVENGEISLRILEQLDLKVWFRYQKYRQEFSLILCRETGRKVHVAVDTTPIGDFVELEGDEEDIRAAAERLGFDSSRFLRDSYFTLYVKFCREREQPVSHMIFPQGQPGGSR